MTQAEPALRFFGLRPGSAPGAWALPVEWSLASGTGALFGGAAAGAAVALAEEATGRPLVWATVQFVEHVRPGAVLSITVEELARGRRASQVEGVARLDGAHGSAVFTFTATTGERAKVVEQAWVVPPSVPRPDDCPPRPVLDRHRGRFMERTEARLARTSTAAGLVADGRSAVWVRVRGLEPGAATLGVVGDYVPFGLRQALGEGWMTHSLDNSLRVLRAPGPGWVLADTIIEGVADGFGHGRVHLWDEAGTLLGTATQSFTCRRRPD